MKTLLILIVALTTGIHRTMAEEPSAPKEMKRVPAGSYLPLYLKDAKPRAVAEFSMDEHAVTNAQFLEFVKRNPRWQRSKVPRLFADPGYLGHWAGDTDPGTASPDSPVTNVSWFAARAFLQANGKRLPTTDEWEYAAQADATKADASKDPVFTRQLLEWYSKPAPASLPAAAAPAPNVHGLRGLHGVAWEWVSDFNNAMDTGEGRSGGSLERELYCAGGAASVADRTNYAAFMRYALRTSLRAGYTMSSLTFRGAWSPGTVAPAPGGASPENLPPLSVYHTSGTWRNQRGEALQLGALGSHWQILCMGYTSCQYACPRITADMRAIERGLRTLRMDGVNKVLAGLNTPEEVLRVTQLDAF